MKCPKCHFESPPDTNFCPRCGSRLSGEVFFTQTLTVGTPTKILAKGSIFAGKYKIHEEIGRGGMGIVYKAEDIKLKRTVALKFLPQELASYPEAKDRFLREAQAAAVLDHPNICTVYEAEEAEAIPYIAMAYIEGLSLREEIAKGPLEVRQAFDLAVQIAEGLEAAHQKGIVHRDIKSGNIMITEGGQAKIMDFGLAKVSGEVPLTKEARTIGTIAYMSPEQAQGEDLDKRTDLWSFGVVLYEMLTGQMPFRGDRESIILHSIVEAEPKPLRQLKSDVPAELQKIIDRALKKKREDRYASAAEIAVDLKRYLDSRRAEEAGFFNLRSLAKRLKRPAYFIPTAAVLIALGVFAYWLVHRNAQIRWARQVAIPQIEKFIQADDFASAYKLTKQAAGYIGKDPKISEYLSQVTGNLTTTTDPPGAQFFLKDYAAADTAFELVGLTPLDKVSVPVGYKRFKIVKDGFDTVEGAGQIYTVGTPEEPFPPSKIKLNPRGSIPLEMIRVSPDSKFTPRLNSVGNLPALKLGDYLLDKFEVTNRQYKKFMDEGGYRRPEFWKQKYRRDGKEIRWEQAMKSFVDKTDRPGPATWELGQFPDGQEDYPVSGVSWYEAAAYAEYGGKSLPTIYHWRWAAGDHSAQGMLDSGYIIPHSNFNGKGTTRVGERQGLSPVGAYDMAGNVKEWCWNETSDGKKGSVGGGWDEPNYMFGALDRYSAWSRYPDFGFRCMKYLTPSRVDIEAAKPIPLEIVPPLGDLKPCSDEMFQVYLKLYEYTKSPLNAKIEGREDLTKNTIFEQVSFDPAYVGDRAGAYLFIPKEGRGPFQTVVHWPGGGAFGIKSFFEYGPKDMFDYLTKTGRAVALPIVRGTFDRAWTPEIRSRTTTRERYAMMVKDFMRALDYLETRPEFDMKKLAYEGLSWGAGWGEIVPAIEKRIKALVLFGCMLEGHQQSFPEWNAFNFAPRITAPVLIQNGKYDFLMSWQNEMQITLGLFGTPDKDKTLKLYEAGHAVWVRMEQKRDELDFLDKYLGPAK